MASARHIVFPSGNRALQGTIFGPDVATVTPALPRIGACGASYGAYLVALLSDRRLVQRLVLRAPALASDVSWPQGGVPAKKFDSLAALSRFSGPVLILESEHDKVVLHPQILAHLAACAHAEHQVIAGAEHTLSDPAWVAVFVDAVILWFRDL